MPAWRVLRQTAIAWNQHEATRLGASLAFYTVLSLAPLVILSIAIASVFINVHDARQDIMDQFRGLLGPAGAQAIADLIKHGKDVKAGSIASILGIITLLFGASQVFSELQSALNKIWEADASRITGVWAVVRQRFLSFGLVLAIGLLMMISLMFSAALSALGTIMDSALPLPEWVLHGFDYVLSVATTSALFALIFKLIPQVETDWRHSWIGGLTTAALFSLGKMLIGLYLGKAGVGSAYGAAGSLVVVVAWVYYSSQIFFFGAEFTFVLTRNERERNAKGRAVSSAAVTGSSAEPSPPPAAREPAPRRAAWR